MNRDQELLDLINAANIIEPAQLTLSDVRFYAPQIDTSSLVGKYNTKIVVEALPGSLYTGRTEVFYHRIPMTDLIGSMLFLTDEPVTMAHLLELINARSQSDLKIEDIEPIVISDLVEGDILNFKLKSKEPSLKWVGERNIEVLYGLPSNLNELYILMNITLPKPGYIQ